MYRPKSRTRTPERTDFIGLPAPPRWAMLACVLQNALGQTCWRPYAQRVCPLSGSERTFGGGAIPTAPWSIRGAGELTLPAAAGRAGIVPATRARAGARLRASV